MSAPTIESGFEQFADSPEPLVAYEDLSPQELAIAALGAFRAHPAAVQEAAAASTPVGNPDLLVVSADTTLDVMRQEAIALSLAGAVRNAFLNPESAQLDTDNQDVTGALPVIKEEVKFDPEKEAEGVDDIGLTDELQSIQRIEKRPTELTAREQKVALAGVAAALREAQQQRDAIAITVLTHAAHWVEQRTSVAA
jgi:hypothetical protein